MKKLNLPNNVYSPQDLSSLVLEIHEYARWHSHNDVKKRAGSKVNDPPAISSDAKQFIDDWSGKKDIDAKKLDSLINSLEDLREDAPLITITLAAPASGDVKETLVKWCRNNIASNILVRFGFDQTLLGGMVVRFGSHIYDWSFKRSIMLNRGKIPEVLRHV